MIFKNSSSYTWKGRSVRLSPVEPGGTKTYYLTDCFNMGFPLKNDNPYICCIELGGRPSVVQNIEYPLINDLCLVWDIGRDDR
jgi:hypothetical protein